MLGVRDANFSVKEGEIFCSMGLSGSSKSTLVRHVNRLIEPTSGQIHVAGARVDTLAELALRKLKAEAIGMVFQHMALWPHRTLSENVGFGLEVRDVPLKLSREAAAKALDAMDHRSMMSPTVFQRMLTVLSAFARISDLSSANAISIELKSGL